MLLSRDCAGAVFRYFQQVEQKVEDAKASVINSQPALVEQLSKELALTKRTLARKSQQRIHARQLSRQLLKRIHELEREFERDTSITERD